MFKHITLLFFITALLAFEGWATTYYSNGSNAPNTLTNWKLARNNTGSSPSNFTSGDVFVIQNGHNMTTSATWSISGAGSKLWIENGGTLTATSAITLASATTFQIEDGGKYVHSNADAFGTTIFQGTESFSSNSTVEFTNWNSTGPANITWGNLTFNGTGTIAGSMQWAGALQTVNGNLTVVATGSPTVRDIRLSTTINYTLTIAGDFIVSGGSMDLSNGTSGTSMVINVGGNLTINGGSLKCSNTSCIPTIGFNGNSSQFTFSSGTLTNTNINWAVNSSKSLTLNDNLPVASGRTLTVNGTLDCGTKLVTGAGTFTLGNGATLKIGSSAGITSSGATGNIQTTNRSPFNSAANYVYNGTTQSFGNGLPTTLTGNIQIASTSSITATSLTMNSPGTMTVDGILALGSGVTIGGNGAFTLSSGGTLQIGSTTGLSGNITVSGTKTYNSNATYEFNGTTAQVTSTSLPETISGTLKINNSFIVTLSQSTTVTTVDMASGNLDLGSNNLTLTNLSISSPSSSKMIIADDGELRKTYTGDGAFTFPIGDNTSGDDYSPVTLDLVADGYSSAYVSAKVTDAKHPNNTSATSYLTRYWTFQQTGVTNPLYDISLYYVNGDVVGNEADIYSGKRTGTIWYLLNATNTGENRLSGTTVSGFSDFTGGEAGALPVELTSFTASAKGTVVTLNWETKTEVDNNGFEVERNVSGNWDKIGFVEGHGTANSPKYYSFVDNAAIGNKIQYRLKQIDNDGTFEYSPEVEVELNPTTFALYQNYPNPFNPSTMIRFSMPVNGNVALNVFNTLGEKVASLLDGQMEAGYHEVSFDAQNLPSGLYFYEIKVGDFSSIKKMILIK